MATTVDEIIDRRQLRKKVSFWRVLTFLVAALALVAMVLLAARDAVFSQNNEDHIARIKITGVITNDEPMLKLIKSVKEEERIKAVVLHISSPGGSTVGGEVMYQTIRELADAKPTVTSIGSLAASAGYMIASATDHIVAHRSSIVGSIGVLFQYADASELLDKIGVKVNSVKSSPLKAEPSPFNTTSPEAVAMINRAIQDSYEWFVDIVTERRDLTRSEVLAVADGSIFTGNQGMKNGLVDELGGQDVAVKWLETKKGIAEDLEVIEYKPKRPGDSFFENPAAFVHLARFFGIELETTDVNQLQSELRERLFLDGLVSIWQSSR